MKKQAHDTDSGALPLRISALATVLCILFGGNAVAIKISLTGIGVYSNTAIRFGVASILLLCWALLTGKNLYVEKNKMKQLVVVAIVFFLQMSFFYNGQKLTSASHGVLITNLAPFIIMAFAHFLLPDEQVSVKKIFGLLLGFCGICLLLNESKDVSVYHSLRGDMLIMVGVLFWGFNAVYVKKIITGYNAFQVTIYPMVIATPMYLACSVLTGEQMVTRLTPEVILAIGYQTVVTATFGFIIWNSLLARFGTSTLHSYVFIMPVSGVFFGILFLGDPISHSLIGAISFVTAGLVVINHKTPKLVRQDK